MHGFEGRPFLELRSLNEVPSIPRPELRVRRRRRDRRRRSVSAPPQPRVAGHAVVVRGEQTSRMSLRAAAGARWWVAMKVRWSVMVGGCTAVWSRFHSIVAMKSVTGLSKRAAVSGGGRGRRIGSGGRAQPARHKPITHVRLVRESCIGPAHARLASTPRARLARLARLAHLAPRARLAHLARTSRTHVSPRPRACTACRGRDVPLQVGLNDPLEELFNNPYIEHRASQ